MKRLIKEIIPPVCFLIVAILLHLHVSAQSKKEVNNQTQSWVSLNSRMRLYKKFGAIADIHIRRNNFIKDPGFYFVRVGANYWLTENLTAVLGYGQMWVAPAKPGWHHYAQEQRVYQQIQLASKIGKIGLLNRLRNEQRWQEKISNDQFTHSLKFTDRVRYLLSIDLPVFNNVRLPSVIFSDELTLQFGKETIYNTFDQNRSFIGIKQQINKCLNFDLGYMLVYQQKASGYQYDKNNTFRCFFYYTRDFRKKKGG